MSGLIAERCRELIRQVCKVNEVEIIKGHVSKDHAHLFVSVMGERIFCSKFSNITDEMIKEYIENQDIEKMTISEFQILKLASAKNKNLPA